MNKKLYFLIPVLVIIMLFSFAALCNLGGDQAAEDVADDSSVQASEVSEPKEEAKEEQQDKPEEDSDLPEASDDAEDKEDADDDSNSSQPSNQGEEPTVSLKIYEGPTYSQADDVCYYRVEAAATGDPKPSIKFSRDDSNGAWGNNRVQINIKKGESYTLTVTATNSEGSATDSIKLGWGCGDTNHNPEIAGIGLSANELYTLTEYELSTAATDPDGDSLTYKWSVDGGTLSSSTSNPTKWETPGFPETYHITLEVSDGKGGKDTETKAVRVEELFVIVGNPPEIHDIVVYGNPLCTGTKYEVRAFFSDPEGDIDRNSLYFDASDGTLSDHSYDTVYWTTPLNSGDYSIAFIVRDLDGHESMLVEAFTVEACWQVIN
jgi:hypothetical protein